MEVFMRKDAAPVYGRMIVSVLLFTVLTAGSCTIDPGLNSGSTGTLKIVSWNVQAFFDSTENGDEYDDYKDSAGWAGEKYHARLTGLAEAVGKMPEGAPDILALIEIENSRILEDLARDRLGRYGYQWTFFSRNKSASLGLGVLSRFPFTETKVHGITYDQESSPRPVLELRLTPGGFPLVLFVCHWKSKLGNEEITETLRRSSARIIARRLREITAEDPDIPVIVMGDLNENHDEFYRMNGKVLSALLPDDPDAAELVRTDTSSLSARLGIRDDFLVLSGSKPPVSEYFEETAAILYSPWGQELQDGSYFYNNDWETIDHFLLSGGLFNRTGWDFQSCYAGDQEPFISQKGIPAAYNPRTGQGLSDHLPLILVLRGS
jgi:endonuclease/exonuclease/phosphatase family metal-dependent hydrolase